MIYSYNDNPFLLYERVEPKRYKLTNKGTVTIIVRILPYRTTGFPFVIPLDVGQTQEVVFLKDDVYEVVVNTVVAGLVVQVHKGIIVEISESMDKLLLLTEDLFCAPENEIKGDFCGPCKISTIGLSSTLKNKTFQEKQMILAQIMAVLTLFRTHVIEYIYAIRELQASESERVQKIERIKELWSYLFDFFASKNFIV